MNRRKYLSLIGVAALAGCLGQGSDDENSDANGGSSDGDDGGDGGSNGGNGGDGGSDDGNGGDGSSDNGNDSGDESSDDGNGGEGNGNGGPATEFDIDTSSPTAIVESWYPIFIEGSLETQQEAAPAVFHSESPELELIENQQAVTDGEFEGIETEVVAEDLSQEDLQDPQRGFFVTNEVATMVEDAEESAEVEATYSYVFQGSAQEQAVTLVLVTEDGEWQIMLSAEEV